MSFVRRKIELTFQIGEGTFGETNFNTVTVSGLRVKSVITKAGGASMGEAQLRVYGLTLSLMNQLSALNRANMVIRRNRLIIAAGDDEAGMSTVFDGQIALGQIDMSGMPDSALVVIAYAGLLDAVQPVAPASYPATVDAAVVMANLAKQMGYSFENNGVSVILATPYFQGTARDQAMRCADAANINWVIDNGVLAIWPKYGTRGGTVPLISPDTGMVGYPSYSEVGISVTTLFNPFINYGETVEVKSSLEFANGRWNVFNISHELESELPDGIWFTKFTGSPINVAA